MTLTIVLIVLYFVQHVMSHPRISSPRANFTRSLVKRDEIPTFSIDRSCRGNPQIQTIVDDWQRIAQVTARRMSLGDRDPRFQWAFQVIFGITMDNPREFDFDLLEQPCTASAFVEFVTSNIASFIPHQDPNIQPNLIFYCDNDAKNPAPYTRERWQVRPDLRNDPLPNSVRQDGVNKEWFDQFNFITRDPSTNGCLDGGREPTWMETYHRDIVPFLYGNRLAPSDLQEQRSTITICDRVFNPENEFYTTILAANPFTISPHGGRPLPLSRVNYDRILSATMYHESTHWTGVKLQDVVLSDGSLAYGWQKIQQIRRTRDKLTNAESYMFLGLLAVYEDLGFWLDPHEGRAGIGVVVRAPRGWVAP